MTPKLWVWGGRGLITPLKWPLFLRASFLPPSLLRRSWLLRVRSSTPMFHEQGGHHREQRGYLECQVESVQFVAAGTVFRFVTSVKLISIEGFIEEERLLKICSKQIKISLATL